jgi:hypothetical protein
MFTGTPSDSLADLAYKIEGKFKAKASIGPMLENPDEAMSTVMAMIKQFGGVKLPSQTLGPEERAYIEQSFQVGPGRKFATIDDIPDQYINFAIGYGLVGLASGGGLRSFTDAIGAGTANVQQQYDQEFATSQAQFEASRAMNMALAKRQGEIAGENFKQEGYYAKDMRDLAEKVTSSIQTLDRQMQIGALTSLTDFFKTGDSDRWNQYVESMGPILQKMKITLPKLMPKTSKESQVDAAIASMGLKDQRLNQVMQFAKDLHPYEMEKLMTEISILDGKDQQAGVRLEMLQKELSWMDKEKRAQVMLIGARAESLKTQAEAALERAKKANTKLPDDITSKLKVITGVNASIVGQLYKEKSSLASRIKGWQKTLDEAIPVREYVAKDDKTKQDIKNEKDALTKLIKDSEKAMSGIDDRISKLISAQESAAASLGATK